VDVILIKPLRAAACHLAVLLGAVCFELPPALPEDGGGTVAHGAFRDFQKQSPEMSGTSKVPKKAPAVTVHPSFWQCSDGETALIVDIRGNACYARVDAWSPDVALSSDVASRPPSRSIEDGALIQKTRQLATAWLTADGLRSAKPAVKRETLLLARLPGGKISEIPGRTIVRLVGPDDIGDGFFQAVFGPTGDLLRIDIAFASARTNGFCNRNLLASMTAAEQASGGNRLTLGCFFDPSEYRFEISAFSVEGESFLNLDQASNTFGRDSFDLKVPHRVSVERYRSSQDYHWWCWAWWHHYGCVGCFRGNWLEKTGRTGWEYPEHVLLHHRLLSSYETTQGPPRQTKVIQQSDGPIRYPYAISQTFKAAFYKDLEQCNVAFIFTHGGPIQGVYQVRRGLDVWVKLMPPSRKLGAGKLRHLFLDGCAAFTYRREPRAAHLVKTWIRQAPVSGLRTVCGVDGEASLLDRCGWRFFGHYNKGESISDSWAFALLDEFVENCPATAAYGATINEAVETLLRGRFTDEKAQTKAVAISIWSGGGTR
jgi:hypothetical protein